MSVVPGSYHCTPTALLMNPSLLTLLDTIDLGWRYEGAVSAPAIGAIPYGKKFGKHIWRHNPTGYIFDEQFVVDEITLDEANQQLRDSMWVGGHEGIVFGTGSN